MQAKYHMATEIAWVWFSNKSALMYILGDCTDGF